MPMIRPECDSLHAERAPLRYPRILTRSAASSSRRPAAETPGSAGSATEVLDALQCVSRKITDLARELKCLGYFDDANDSRPRAA
jgi:hypothetical protein